MTLRQSSLPLIVLLFGLWLQPLSAQSLHSVEAEDGTEIPVELFPAPGGARLLWLPAETGLQEADREQARRLSSLGVEVWLVDLFAARFLPLAQSSVDQMPAMDVAAVIAAASEGGGPVYLLAPGRGAIPLLRGVRLWQQMGRGPQVDGLILLHPKLYVETPDPGEAAQFMPVVRQSNQAIYLLQPELSPWRWRLDEITSALQAGGSDVYVQLLRGVRDRFYFRPDAVAQESEAAEALAGHLLRAMVRLRYVQKPRGAAGQPSVEAPEVVVGKKERLLKPYAGNPSPAPLRLRDLEGRERSLADHRGRVVLVNFWASWCPPCVHEMPSMQSLYQDYRQRGLDLLAVNMAEDPATVKRFLREKVEVDFPILLDRDGEALRTWGVFAFPTSYLIDRQGRIRYALFGAVDWQRGDIQQVIETLLAQK